jgi:hypothetical protein
MREKDKKKSKKTCFGYLIRPRPGFVLFPAGEPVLRQPAEAFPRHEGPMGMLSA